MDGSGRAFVQVSLRPGQVARSAVHPEGRDSRLWGGFAFMWPRSC